MTNRCPECNKFVPPQLDQPEPDDVQVEDMGNGKGLLTIRLSLSKICADCGTELSIKEVEAETEIDLSGFESVV